MLLLPLSVSIIICTIIIIMCMNVTIITTIQDAPTTTRTTTAHRIPGQNYSRPSQPGCYCICVYVKYV